MTKENRRYYWIQLAEDFFKSKEMKLLRRIAGGDTYTIIYLKLMIASLNDEGLLYFDSVAESLAEELSLLIDETEEDVSVVLSFLSTKGLLTTNDDGSIFLEQVPEMIGSETASTRRSRKHRERKALQCNANATKRNRDIEKETDINIEKEIEIDKPSLIIANHCQNHGLFIDGQQLQMLEDFHAIDGMHIDVVCRAVTEAADNGKRNLKYILAILRNWKTDGITTLSQVEDRERQRLEQKSNGYQARPNQTNVPNWADKPVEKHEPTAEEKARLEELKAAMMSREG